MVMTCINKEQIFGFSFITGTLDLCWVNGMWNVKSTMKIRLLLQQASWFKHIQLNRVVEDWDNGGIGNDAWFLEWNCIMVQFRFIGGSQNKMGVIETGCLKMLGTKWIVDCPAFISVFKLCWQLYQCIWSCNIKLDCHGGLVTFVFPIQRLNIVFVYQ